MSSFDRCTQPTFHLCSTRAGAPSSLSESHPRPGTQPSGPACPGKTTSPKVPASGPARHQLPGPAWFTRSWGRGAQKGEVIVFPSCRQMGLFRHHTSPCRLQLPFLPQGPGRVSPLLWDPTFLLKSWFSQT